MTVDALAIGAHPDDVEMGMGGTVATLIARGKRVAILDLTRGEMGTRGTAEDRAGEAARAAEILGVDERITLDMGDGVLQDTLENRKTLIEIIRRLRPTIVFGQYWDDLHPDHAAAGRLVNAVMYPSGFSKYPAEGEPYRPNEYLFYMAHSVFPPSFIVDVSEGWGKKMEAVRCYASQITVEEGKEPSTFISSPSFLPGLEARARTYGRQIQREFGEAFVVRRPVPMVDPVDHYLPFSKIHAPARAKVRG